MNPTLFQVEILHLDGFTVVAEGAWAMDSEAAIDMIVEPRRSWLAGGDYEVCVDSHYTWDGPPLLWWLGGVA